MDDFNPYTEPATYTVTVTHSPGEPWSYVGHIHNAGEVVVYGTKTEATQAAEGLLPLLLAGDVVTVMAHHPFADFSVEEFTA